MKRNWDSRSDYEQMVEVDDTIDADDYKADPVKHNKKFQDYWKKTHHNTLHTKKLGKSAAETIFKAISLKLDLTTLK